MREVLDFLYSIIQSAWSMLNSSSAWVVFSFIVAGLLHEFIKPENLQKTAIGSTKVRGVFWTTVTGMLLPICQLRNDPIGNQYVLQRSLSWSHINLYDKYASHQPIGGVAVMGAFGKRNYNYICNFRICRTNAHRNDCESFWRR